MANSIRYRKGRNINSNNLKKRKLSSVHGKEAQGNVTKVGIQWRDEGLDLSPGRQCLLPK